MCPLVPLIWGRTLTPYSQYNIINLYISSGRIVVCLRSFLGNKTLYDLEAVTCKVLVSQAGHQMKTF